MPENTYTLTAGEIAAIRAKAWDEGFFVGMDHDRLGASMSENPYA